MFRAFSQSTEVLYVENSAQENNSSSSEDNKMFAVSMFLLEPFSYWAGKNL